MTEVSAGCRGGTCTTLGTRELKLLETVNLRLPQLQYTQTQVESVSCVDADLKSVSLTQVTWGCSLYLRQLARLLDHTTGRLRFRWSHTTLRLQVLGWCHSTSKQWSPFDDWPERSGSNSNSTWEDWGYLSSESRKWPVWPYLLDSRNLGTIQIGQSDSHTRLGIDDEGREQAKGRPLTLNHSVGATFGISLRQGVTKKGQ